MNIGFDNSQSFDQKYMSFMADAIIKAYKFDFSSIVGNDNEKRHEHAYVDVKGIRLFLNWKKEDYD